jgi:tryptophan-rich sensory protein
MDRDLHPDSRWRVGASRSSRASEPPSFRLWILQLLLNWSWTPVFFGLHQVAVGLLIIIALLATVIVFIVKVRDRIASLCFVPYALWLAYAAALNAAILALN